MKLQAPSAGGQVQSLARELRYPMLDRMASEIESEVTNKKHKNAKKRKVALDKLWKAYLFIV